MLNGSVLGCSGLIGASSTLVSLSIRKFGSSNSWSRDSRRLSSAGRSEFVRGFSPTFTLGSEKGDPTRPNSGLSRGYRSLCNTGYSASYGEQHIEHPLKRRVQVSKVVRTVQRNMELFPFALNNERFWTFGDGSAKSCKWLIANRFFVIDLSNYGFRRWAVDLFRTRHAELLPIDRRGLFYLSLWFW